jgi:hypothetical protein
MTAPFASLIVNKCKLPAILRNDVPPLRLAGTAVESLVATRRRSWGVLHPDVGKQILHRGQAVAILNVHQNTRLVVLIDEEDHRAFWIPRRPTDKKQFSLERMWKSRRRRALLPPAWTGDEPPKRDTVKVLSNYPSTAYLIRLVSELGYNGHAAFSSMIRGHLPWLQLIDRRKKGAKYKIGVHPEHPYHPAAPNRRTAHGGGFSRAQVLASVARMRTSDDIRLACFEVVYRRRFPKTVAKAYGIGWEKLRTYATRVRKRIRCMGRTVQGANKDAVSEVEVYTA